MMELLVIITIVSLMFGGACVILVSLLLDKVDDYPEIIEENDLDEVIEDRNGVIF